MKTVIMAGGKGTRIASIANDIPKPMIRIGGKPILEHQIENLKACGLTDVTLVIGHLGEVISDYFKDGSDFGVHISYFVEEQPLGTAGALFRMPELTDDFLLMCGDVMIDVDFNRFIRFHHEHQAWASLMAHPNGHPYDSSLLVTEVLPPQEPGGLPVETHCVTNWLNKEDERLYYKNRVNAGIEIISPKLLASVTSRLSPLTSKVDLDRDVLKPSIATGRIYAYDTPEYIKDMGTPDRYHEVERDLQSGKVAARNLKNKQRAVFLDRDGTINVYKGFMTRTEDFEIIPGAAEAVRLINRSGYLAIIVSNQPVIARGDCTFDQLKAIHDKMETLLGREGAFVDAIYYCPHHPDRGFEGERADYKLDCDCRKPKAGLLLQAAKEWNIDLSESYMIGDSDRDVQAGITAGCKRSVQIERNQADALMQAVSQQLEADTKQAGFSLLMSVYKKEKAEYLTTCFDSIHQQTLQPTEIILVEDGPLTPELYEAIGREEKRFSMLKRVVLNENQGLGVALNKGMEACNCDIIARMDTDDICMPHRFEVQLKFLEEHPDVDVLGAWITEFDHEPTNIVGVRSLPENHDDIYKFGKKRNPVNHPVAMFRKRAVIEAGGYMPCYLFEDYYLWARMLKQGYRFHNLQEPLLLFRRSPEMIHRRGGLSYAHHEILFLRKLQQIGYLSGADLVRDVLQRYFIRLLPNCLRSFIYKHLLRTIP